MKRIFSRFLFSSFSQDLSVFVQASLDYLLG